VRPLDPRLLRWARATKVFLVASVLAGVITAVAIIAQAYLLASIITRVYQQGADLTAIWPQVCQLAAVVVVRAALAFGLDWSAFHSSARAKSQLRMAVLDHAVALGPTYLEGRRSGELAQLSSRGIDALDNYFARYLPQLVLAVIVPLVVGIVIATQDLLAAVIIAVTLPLIPLFMILIGLYTQGQVERQWNTLGRLAGHFLDVVAGLPTLKVFGRAKAQAETLRQIGERYRSATMGVLRVSFLSALVLELLSTLSVAIVAVSIGLRLVGGSLDLYTALFILILAPEAYLPVRMVGAQFHSAADGIAASAQLLDILDEPLPERGSRRVADVTDLSFADVSATYPGRDVPALTGISFTARPGRITALSGASGCGKSTALRLLLGYMTPASGSVTVSGIDVDSLERRPWLDDLAWLPQDPVLVSGTVRDNIRLSRPAASDTEVAAAAAAAALTEPGVLDQPVTDAGTGLSAGQRRRVGLARVLLRDAPVVVLDEPSAALDADTEEAVVRAVSQLRSDGRLVVLVAHRTALLDLADQVVLFAPPAEQDEADRFEVELPGLRR
jgi:thiol reductant ABC exporter CydD subunit